MTVASAFALVLALLILAVAAWTIAARRTFAAAVGFVAYGLLLSIAWVALSAIDVALTEAAIGGGLTGVLLIGAATRLRATEAAASAERPGASLRWFAALTSATVAGAIAVAVLSLPDPAPTLAPAAAEHLSVTGVGNPITAVLLAYRALDTLLESIVVVFALIGVWSLAPDRVWGGRPGPLHEADPNGVLAYLARVLPPIGIIVGLYIFWIGADLPGGKFQGATILAAMWLLVMMAGLTDAPPISRTWLRILLVAGPLLFIAIGFAGALTAGAVLAYPEGYAKLLIKVIEAALMPTLTLTLALLVAGAPERTAPTMNVPTLFGLCAAALVGFGLYGVITNPQPLRKILAFNLIGNGAFLLFGAIARRGAAAGFGGDPVPHGLLITGIVVAFSATALAVALLLRLFQATGSATLAADQPAMAETADRDAYQVDEKLGVLRRAQSLH